MLIQTQPSNLGYVMVDHRATPAELPPGTPRMFEASTYTCSHCQTVVVLNPERRRQRYTCRGCSHLICDPCGARREAGAACRTFAQIADEVLERAVRDLPPLDIETLLKGP